MLFNVVRLALSRGAYGEIYQSELEHFKEVLSEYRAYDPDQFNALEQNCAELLQAKLSSPKPDSERKPTWGGTDILGLGKAGS